MADEKADLQTEMKNVSEIPPEKRQSLLEAAKQLVNLYDGRELFRAVAVELRSKFLLGDKTMAQWRREFRITLSDDPTLDEIRQKLSTAWNLYQTAADYLRTSKAALKTAELEYEAAVQAEVRRLVGLYQQHDKRPAREIIKELAESNCLELASFLTNAQIYVDFWSDIVWELRTFIDVLDVAQRTYFSSAKLDAMQPNNIPRCS